MIQPPCTLAKRPGGRRLFLRATAAAVLALAAGCGGGGGGGEPRGSLSGRLVLQQSPQLSAARLATDASGSGTHEDREPNDHLFSAIDLGDGTAAARVAGNVGGVDPADVLRVGPCPRDVVLILRLDAPPGATATGMQCRESGDLGGGFELASGGTATVALRAHEDLAVTLRAQHPMAYVIELTPATTMAAFLPAAVPAADIRQEWTRTLGGDAFRYLPGEVIVRRDTPCEPAALVALGLEVVAQGGGVLRLRRGDAVRWPAAAAGQRAQADLVRAVRRAFPDAAYVSPNLSTPLSALAGLPHAALPLEPNDLLFASAQWNLQLTRFPQAWDLTTGDDRVTIAVVDTGVMVDHPDLAPRISPLGYDFVSDPASAGDGDGVDADPSEPQDFGLITFFHGTYVTGIAGAVSNNGIGVAGGVWKGKIMPIRVFGKLGGSSFDLVQALRYLAGLPNASQRILAAADRPRIVNLSYGSLVPSAAEKAEIENLAQAGTLLIAAAGNDGLVPAPPVYPAAWPEVVAVAAVDRSLARALYSNVADWVDVAAVGGFGNFGPDGVTSTWCFFVDQKFEYGYTSFHGTSVATPAVSAAAALMEAVHPGLADVTLRRILAGSCRDLGAPGRDPEFGEGLLQVDAAVALARQLDRPGVPMVTPAKYQFSDVEIQAFLQVANIGGRPLTDLAISPLGSPSGGVTTTLDRVVAPAVITAAVDRGRVKVGDYLDTFALDSSGGRVIFDVAYRKPIPPPVLPITVRLYDGMRLVAATKTDLEGRFTLRDLPLGSYRLEVGVDLDGNGRLGDPEEWFLARSVEITADQAASLDGVVVPWKR